MRMLLSFQRPPSLTPEVLPSEETCSHRVRGRLWRERRSIALSRAQAPKAALADLQHLPIGTRAGDIVLAPPDGSAAQRHGALVDQPARLGAGDTELLGDQRRQVQLAVARDEAGLLDLLGRLVRDEHAVEVLLGRDRVL